MAMPKKVAMFKCVENHVWIHVILLMLQAAPARSPFAIEDDVFCCFLSSSFPSFLDSFLEIRNRPLFLHKMHNSELVVDNR